MKQHQWTDQTLVERIQQGDKQAFNLLVGKYQHKVAGLVAKYVNSSGDVADVTQEAFIKAYRALPNFRGESAFYTWLYRIAVNTAKNYIVAQGRRPPANDIDVNDAEFYDGGEVMHESSTPESVLLTDEIRQVVFTTIEQLPDELRTAITLREIDGMSYDEIAQIMECPVGTVRSRIFRAREAIDKQIQPLMRR
ncbi:RNA polymerase sigma factor RpoE [Celerinatantimonas diazotrophica]|jgi:RNA polymerase sigma-70 factor (ECF subfamily)|uniref:RNA polymerase RpoE-like sigma-24 subunit n=1 Tax=Celerinatantimonas diazotrophica TaxID=412034 RepID=A0A4R1J956_9GAMM|nr:RNA polymerase sigma factor RpoE [Celerinatantimonas diazotrophica]TCK47143.1 RNA polymerase RpoE-like sigma-24 subunit [Celerinatantimonas diazotrophica]CAG9295915.1 ECF RNA polymerase sigma-E factor [Celerinatantimonas diazotrophica]